MRNFDFYRPESAAAVTDALKKAKGSRPKGGGTDLLPCLKDGLLPTQAVVDLGRVAGLAGVRQGEDGQIIVGAGTTLAAVGEHPLLKRLAPAFAEAGGTAATPLIRARGTVGGNLCQRPRCWYFRNPDYPCAKKGGDTCFAQLGENKYHAIYDNSPCAIVHPSNLGGTLLAHDATIAVSGPKGDRTVAAKDFFRASAAHLDRENSLADGEWVTAVHLQPAAGTAYLEVKEKQSFDWALAAAIARIDLDGKTVKAARVVAAHVAPTPLRFEEAEAHIVGKTLTEKLAFEAGDIVVSRARPLRDNEYKVPMLRALVAHALTEAARRAEAGGR